MTGASNDFYSDEMMATPEPTHQHHDFSSPSNSFSYFDNNDNDDTSSLSSSNDTSPMSSTSLSTVQLVAISNVKLNNDLYSNRSLSIHKRILVKNLLTFIYRIHPPMDWAQMQYQMQMQLGDVASGEDNSDHYGDGASENQGGFGQPPPPPTLGPTGGPLIGRAEQKGWMDRTLQAAGLDDDDDDDDNIPLQVPHTTTFFFYFLSNLPWPP